MNSLFNSPLAVGGTGGSGTRAVQQVLEGMGVFMGNNNSPTRDSQDFAPFFQTHIPRLLTHVQGVDYALEDLPKEFVAELMATLENIARHAETQVPQGATQWGWKNPRSVFMLPFLQLRYPNMRFLHVVRDGRDMALSSNLNQMKLYYTQIFGRPISEPPAISAMELWNKINIEATRWAQQHLGERYYILRFEDLCAAPEEVIKKLGVWLGITIEQNNIASLAALVTPPKSVGRWRSLDNAIQRELEMIGQEGLGQFGYAP